jgi:DNA-damage-inducible protein J
MTIKTAIVRARVTPSIKLGAQKVLDKLGLSISDAINLLLVQIDIKKALPFSLEMPNQEKFQVLGKYEQEVGSSRRKNADDFFEQLGIPD